MSSPSVPYIDFDNTHEQKVENGEKRTGKEVL